MKIACFECDEYEQKILKEKLHGHEITFYNHPLEENEQFERISFTEVLVVFIYSKINREILKRLPFLKLVITLSTGYDHIDLTACKEHGITVCNVPKYGGTAVAEHTFALMLALIRHIPKAVQNTSHDDFSLEGLGGRELAGKTLGVIGAGTIGSAVIRRALAFDMRVLVYERTPNKKLETLGNVHHATFNELLKKSDLVTLHLPYTKETRHIINRHAIKKMKLGAYIINTARGALIDSRALSAALESKHIAGAALDVLEGEYEHKEAHALRKPHHLSTHDWSMIRQTHRMLKMPNVIITPHMAFYTYEALHTILDTAVQNIEQFRKGAPINTVA